MGQARWWTVIRVAELSTRSHQFVRPGRLTDKEITKIVHKYCNKGVIRELGLTGMRYVWSDKKPQR